MHAVQVGLELVLAAVALRDQLRADAGRADHEPGEVAALRGGARHRHDGAEQQAALHRERAVARGGVHDLVAQHGRELRFGMELRQQPAIHGDLPAGQGPGIRHRAVQHHELVGQRPVADGRELLPDAAHVGRERRVERVVAALHLLRRAVLLLPDRDLLVGGDQRELAIAGDRIDRAGGEQTQRSAESAVQPSDSRHDFTFAERLRAVKPRSSGRDVGERRRKIACVRALESTAWP